MKKWAIYVRVSKKVQHTENQELILTEYAKREGYDYDIFREKESTRRIRQVKLQVIDSVINGKYEGIIVLKLDRWGRSLKELVQDMQMFKSGAVNFISIKDKLDFSSAMGRMMYGIISVFAEFERDLLRERTMEGLARARAQGKTIGRKKISQSKIKQIIKLHRGNLTQREIAKATFISLGKVNQCIQDYETQVEIEKLNPTSETERINRILNLVSSTT